MTEPDAGARPMIARWLRAVAEVPRAVWAVIAVALALVAAVALSGGFAQATAQRVEVSAGAEVRTDAYAVTVIDSELTDEVASEFLSADEGEILLVVNARIENRTDAPIGLTTTADRTRSSFLDSETPVMGLAGVTPERSPSVWRPDGSSGQVILQPGVPSEVTIAWTLPDDSFDDIAPEVVLHDVAIRRGAVILSSSVVTWNTRDEIARIPLTPTGTP